MPEKRHDRQIIREMEDRLERLEEGIERTRREAEKHGYLGEKDEPTLAQPDDSGVQTRSADPRR